MMILSHWIDLTLTTAPFYCIAGAILALAIRSPRRSIALFVVLAGACGFAFGRAAYQWGDGVAGGFYAGSLMFAGLLPGVVVLYLVGRWRKRRRRRDAKRLAVQAFD